MGVENFSTDSGNNQAEQRKENKTRGPYIDDDIYNKVKLLSQKKDLTVEEALEQLIDICLNSRGDITVGPVQMKFEE